MVLPHDHPPLIQELLLRNLDHCAEQILSYLDFQVSFWFFISRFSLEITSILTGLKLAWKGSNLWIDSANQYIFENDNENTTVC